MQIIDYAFQEIPVGSALLPISLSQGQEISLTSIFLQVAAINNKIEMREQSVGEGQLLIVAELPKPAFSDCAAPVQSVQSFIRRPTPLL